MTRISKEGYFSFNYDDNGRFLTFHFARRREVLIRHIHFARGLAYTSTSIPAEIEIINFPSEFRRESWQSWIYTEYPLNICIFNENYLMINLFHSSLK